MISSLPGPVGRTAQTPASAWKENGVKLSEIDRQRLYRLRYEPGESQAEREEVAAA